MFHTYVRPTKRPNPVSRGHQGPIDFDRATWLMDQDILRAAEAAMGNEMREHPRSDASYGAQWLWDWYCERHFEKYGESFAPDTDPNWDRSSNEALSSAAPSKPRPIGAA